MSSLAVTTIRTNLKKVSKHLKGKQVRLTVDELLAVCARTGPSETLPRQGQLFEAFIEMCASRVKYTLYKTACKQAAPGEPIDGPTTELLLKQLRLRFYGWLLMSLANIGTPGKLQLWYVTSIIKFLGLSRLGQNVMQTFGFAGTLRYSDGRKKVALAHYDTIIRDVRDHPHIYNFDNYSNIIASYIATSAKGAYANCAWTGHTLRKLDPAVDFMIQWSGRRPVPAMPESLFSDELWDALVVTMTHTDEEGSRYLAKSLVHTSNVRSFPPKAHVCDELRASDPDLADLLEAGSRDSLDEVYPCDVTVENCGSNEGLAVILQHIYTEYGVEDGNCDDYLPIMVDVNIYHRILKGLYTLGNCGAKYRAVTAPLLGLWHTFKMAHAVLYRNYAKTFLAPLFHHIIPGHTFFEHPGRLIQMQETFTNLRLAFDADVQAALRAAMSDPRMSARYKGLLQNLKDLLQFFIPTVQDYGFSIKLKDGKVVFNNLKRMLKVFLCLEPDQEYVRSLVHQLLTLIYWRKNKAKLPFWDLFCEDVGKFNEEPIELSFSLLGRSLVNDGMRTDIAHVRDKYKDVKNYVMFKKEFQKEFLDKDTMKSVSGRFHIKEGNLKLAQVKAWFLDTINKCRYNTYVIYTDKLAYKSATLARDYCMNLDAAHITMHRLYLADSVSVLKQRKEKHRLIIESDWGNKAWGDVWDEYKVEDEEEEEEEEEIQEEDNSEEEQEQVIVKPARKKHPERSKGKHEKPVTDDELSDAVDAQKTKTSKKKQKPQVDFRNRLADADAAVNEEFERLKDEWLQANPGQTLTGATYYKMSDKASENVAMALGSKRRRVGNQKGVYNEHIGHETDVAAGVRASLDMFGEEMD